MEMFRFLRDVIRVLIFLGGWGAGGHDWEGGIDGVLRHDVWCFECWSRGGFHGKMSAKVW